MDFPAGHVWLQEGSQQKIEGLSLSGKNVQKQGFTVLPTNRWNLTSNNYSIYNSEMILGKKLKLASRLATWLKWAWSCNSHFRILKFQFVDPASVRNMGCTANLRYVYLMATKMHCVHQ